MDLSPVSRLALSKLMNQEGKPWDGRLLLLHWMPSFRETANRRRCMRMGGMLPGGARTAGIPFCSFIGQGEPVRRFGLPRYAEAAVGHITLSPHIATTGGSLDRICAPASCILCDSAVSLCQSLQADVPIRLPPDARPASVFLRDCVGWVAVGQKHCLSQSGQAVARRSVSRTCLDFAASIH